VTQKLAVAHAKKSVKSAPERRVEPSPRKRRRLPSDERRTEILNGARAVFATKGLNGGRMRDIAKAADANIATVFAHFPSKEELFDAAVSGPLEELFASQSAAESPFLSGTLEEKWALSRNGFREYLTAMHDNLPLLIAALFADHEHGERFYKAYMMPFFQRMSAHIERSNPEVKERNLDPRTLGLVVFGVHLMLALDAHYRGKPLPIKANVDNLMELLSRQFLMPVGPKQMSAGQRGNGKGSRSRSRTAEHE